MIINDEIWLFLMFFFTLVLGKLIIWFGELHFRIARRVVNSRYCTGHLKVTELTLQIYDLNQLVTKTCVY